MMKVLNIKFKLTSVISLFLLLTIQQSVLAKEKEFLLDEKTHTVLTEAHKDMEAGNNTSALSKLNKLVASGKIKDYDAAVVYQTMGYAENGLNNFKNAAGHFIKALSFNALPEKVTHDLQYSTAQLLIHIEKPKEGLAYLSKWFANEPKPKADAHILAATAYYYTENYKQLITHVEKALLLNKKPPLNWYELLLAGYYELKDYKNAVVVLENIIAKYPEKTNYWMQLAAIYQQLNQEKKALALFELAYTKELLNKEEIVQLIKSYRYLEMPYKAATLLEKEMAIGDIEANKEMLTLLVDSWILAQENDKAKSVFQEIVKRFNDDTARLRLGQLYLESEEWKEVIELLDVKLQTNDKTLISKINLLLGIAQYHLDNLSGATRAFTQSLSDSSTADQAKWWLEHVRKKSGELQKS
jgi:tetratricopeptide (TPR) repeat protein